MTKTYGTQAARPRGEAGVTLIELMIYLVIVSIVVGSIYRLMINQSRGYADQREITDARETVRGAAVLLTSELRQLSASDGDIYLISADSITLRSVLATAIVCERNLTQKRYALWSISGDLQATTDDSALVFAADQTGQSDDAWRVVDIENNWSPGVGGITACAWDVAHTPDRVVGVSHDTDIVYVGAAFRSFRRVQYGIFSQGGNWWLGRKVGAAASYEKLTGPLLAPGATGGLVFTYYDASGAVTAVPADVRTIEITIRSQSAGQSRQGASLSARYDSLRTKVFLRG